MRELSLRNALASSGLRRVLAVTWDGAGNLPPQLAVYEELISRGVAVEVLAHDTQRAAVEAAGCRFLSLECADQFDACRSRVEVEDELEDQLRHVFFSPGFVADVLRVISDRSPDLVLVDFCLVSTIAAVERSGRPCIVLWHSVFRPMIEGSLGPMLALGRSWLDSIRRELDLEPLAQPIDQYRRVRRILVLTASVFGETHSSQRPAAGRPTMPREFEAGEIEVRSATWAHAVVVGPLTPRQGNLEAASPPLDAKREQLGWPGAPDHDPRPWVLLSFSTSDQAQAQPLAICLEALSLLPVRILVTTGPALESSALTLPPNARGVSWVPHDRVLPHVTLVVTHAGHGTVMASLRHGVPLVCWPQGRDQHLVAACVDRLGVGHVVGGSGTGSVGEVDPRSLRTLLEFARSDRRAREQAERLADHFDPAVSRRRALEAIIDALRTTE